MGNIEYEFVQLGEYFYIDIDKEVVKYKGQTYSKSSLEKDQQVNPRMKRFIKFLLERYQEGKPVVEQIDLYVAYSTRTNRTIKDNKDREDDIRVNRNIDNRTVPKFYDKISQLIVNFHAVPRTLKEEEKKKCYIKKNEENQFWYEPPLDDKANKNSKLIENVEDSVSLIANQLQLDINDVVEKDSYYIEEIKKRLLQFTGLNTRLELGVLENRLFYETRCERLSDGAKRRIDDFFTSEVITLLTNNGISETLAEWYATIWTILVAREEYKRRFELCERAQLYDRAKQMEINLLKVEVEFANLAESIHSYNQSFDKGGKM